jgi:hypothetical protein
MEPSLDYEEDGEGGGASEAKSASSTYMPDASTFWMTLINKQQTKNYVALVRERTIPTE